MIINKDELKSPAIDEVSSRCVFSDFTFITCLDFASAAAYINNMKVCIKE